MKNNLIFISLVNGLYGLHVNYNDTYNENYNSTAVTEDNYWDDYNDYYNNADNTDYNITKYPSIYSNTSDSYADYYDDYAYDDSSTADYLNEDKKNDYIDQNDNQNEENKKIRLATVMDNFFKKVERSWSQVKQRLSKILL